MAKSPKIIQNVFERREKKYLVRPEQYAPLRGALEGLVAADAYGRHTICSLYCDNDEFDVIRRSLDRPAYKEKLRLRSYGVPRREDTVYLELKKKLDGVTYKRRMPLALAEAEAYLWRGVPPLYGGQIFGEIDFFVCRTHCVPTMVLCCERVALAGVEDMALRITFDENVRWRREDLSLARGDWGAPLLPPGHRLMEIKVPGVMPLGLSRLLSQLAIYPVSFSKYGNAYGDMLTEEVRCHAV